VIKVLLDSNILVSAILNNHGVPYQAYKKAVEPPYQSLICEQSIEELRRVFNRKFPDRVRSFERFIATTLFTVELIPVPHLPHPDENKIPDVSDRPILRAAIYADANIIITGDKDFLESGLDNPKIMTAADFLQLV